MRSSLKTFLFLAIFLICSTKPANAQITLIPDPNFEQALIDLGLDTAPINGSVPTANISHITSLTIANKNINDLTGIQDFMSLTELNCNNNNLTNLDVTHNTALAILSCDQNNITTLDVTLNTVLTSLDCAGNQLTSLDVTKNRALYTLECSFNHLTSVDVTYNTALFALYCDGNQLMSLDVTHNFSLSNLICNSNNLTSLDVTNNTALKWLNCSHNQLTSLDVTHNTTLNQLVCDNNQIINLNVTQNPGLAVLWCNQNNITSLDVTLNPVLGSLDCAGNQLQSLDVTGDRALQNLMCNLNHLISLDVTNNIALVFLHCDNNQITSLDLTKNTRLTQLFCYNNQLTTLNLKNGYDSIMTTMKTINNPNLTCIQVDNAIAAAGYSGWSKDATAYYSEYCTPVIPTIISFSPMTGCTGQVITITGTYLDLASAVTFGGVAASSFSVLSATSIIATVGTGASGDIHVIYPGGIAAIPGFIFNQLPPPASVNISSTRSTICTGTSVTFTATPINGGATPVFQWQVNGSMAGTNSPTFITNSLSNGDKISCTMNTATACSGSLFVYSDTIVMVVKSIPAISFNPGSAIITLGNSVQLNATITGNYSGFLWTPANGLNNPTILNPVANPATTTIYKLKVISDNCDNSKEITVSVLNKIYIPASFTPNGDGLNDIFRIPPGVLFYLQTFSVYTREGNKIFQTHDISKGWDGTYKGTKSPSGAYVYLIKGSDAKGEILLKGTVILIR